MRLERIGKRKQVLKKRTDDCCLLINKEFQFEQIRVPHTNLDVIIGYITKSGLPPILIALYYYPPDLKINLFHKCCKGFMQNFINKKTKIMILGDFNVPDMTGQLLPSLQVIFTFGKKQKLF